jgi:acyl-CoA thioester hydrolase
VALPENGIGEHHIAVPPQWLDDNQQMNVACYSMAFDLAGDEFAVLAGMGEDYARETGNSYMVVEAHLTYRREARARDALRIETRLLECDHKRLHFYQEMYRGGDLLATEEQLLLHVSLVTRRSSPFEPAVMDQWRTLQAAQSGLPVPRLVGHAVGLDPR